MKNVVGRLATKEALRFGELQQRLSGRIWRGTGRQGPSGAFPKCRRGCPFLMGRSSAYVRRENMPFRAQGNFKVILPWLPRRILRLMHLHAAEPTEDPFVPEAV
jgi:hypothetical protein